MLIDTQLLMSDAQAVTSTGDTASTNIIDLGASRDVGPGSELDVIVTVNEGVASAGAATVTFKVQTDDNSGFSSPTDLMVTGAIGKASLPQGAMPVRIKLPPGVERYLRVVYTVGAAALTAGKFTAFLTSEQVDSWRVYPNNYDVA